MKQKILLGLIAVAMSGSVSADTSTANHSATVTVEEVAIISVSATPIAFATMAAPTTAGQTFAAPAAIASTYSITSNVANATPGTRALSAVVGDPATGVALDASLVLSANVTAPGVGTGGTATALSATAADLVTGITNIAAEDVNISYTLALATTTSVPPHGAYGATVTYTLGDD